MKDILSIFCQALPFSFQVEPVAAAAPALACADALAVVPQVAVEAAKFESSSSCCSFKRRKHAGSTWGQSKVNLHRAHLGAGAVVARPALGLEPGVLLGEVQRAQVAV